jgi:hypothetical protein
MSATPRHFRLLPGEALPLSDVLEFWKRARHSLTFRASECRQGARVRNAAAGSSRSECGVDITISKKGVRFRKHRAKTMRSGFLTPRLLTRGTWAERRCRSHNTSLCGTRVRCSADGRATPAFLALLPTPLHPDTQPRLRPATAWANRPQRRRCR